MLVTIQDAQSRELVSEDGDVVELELRPGLSAQDLARFERSYRAVPPSVRELLQFCSGFSGPIELARFHRSQLSFELEAIFPAGLPIGLNGCSNFCGSSSTYLHRPANGHRSIACHDADPSFRSARCPSLEPRSLESCSNSASLPLLVSSSSCMAELRCSTMESQPIGAESGSCKLIRLGRHFAPSTGSSDFRVPCVVDKSPDRQAAVGMKRLPARRRLSRWTSSGGSSRRTVQTSDGHEPPCFQPVLGEATLAERLHQGISAGRAYRQDAHRTSSPAHARGRHLVPGGSSVDERSGTRPHSFAALPACTVPGSRVSEISSDRGDRTRHSEQSGRCTNSRSGKSTRKYRSGHPLRPAIFRTFRATAEGLELGSLGSAPEKARLASRAFRPSLPRWRRVRLGLAKRAGIPSTAELSGIFLEILPGTFQMATALLEALFAQLNRLPPLNLKHVRDSQAHRLACPRERPLR